MGQALRVKQARQGMQKITNNIFSLVLAVVHPSQSLWFLALSKEASVKCSQSKWVQWSRFTHASGISASVMKTV